MNFRVINISDPEMGKNDTFTVVFLVSYSIIAVDKVL